MLIKIIALGLKDFNGNEIPASVRLGEDPNGDFSEESVKNQMNANAEAIFNYIETLYAYNNYEFNASVSDSIVNMHIALDAIKNIAEVSKTIENWISLYFDRLEVYKCRSFMIIASMGTVL